MQTKITLLMIFVAVIPAVFLGRYALWYQEEVLAHNLRIYQGFSSVLKIEITRRIWGYRKLLSTMTQMPSLARMDPREVKDVLERILLDDGQKEQGLDGIVVYGRNKKLIASAGTVLATPPPATLFSDAFFDTFGGNASDLPRMQRSGPAPTGVSGLLGGAVPASLVDVPSDSGTSTQLRFLIMGPRQEIVGVLIGILSPEYLSRSVNKVMKALSEIEDAASRVDIYVLDSTDRRIAASRDAKYQNEPYIITAALASRDPALRKRVDVPLKSFYTPDWRILLVMRPKAYESTEKIKTTVRRTILVAVMVAIALGLVLTRTITKPLSRLVLSALRISQGDLSEPVEVQSRDEIGDLAATFEMMRINLARMQENLRDRIDELATLYDVGKAIGSTLNLQELLNLILDMVMKLVKAERGSIMLLDEDSQELKIAVSQGLEDDVVERTRVRMGERVSGYVLETGKPLLIPDSTKSPSFLKLKETRVEQGALLAVPLITKDKKLGVLNISKSIPYSLGERELEFFKALSTQASIAIENARLYELAIKDEMTKLYIRRYFDQRIREEMRRSKRYKNPVTLMLLDIDHFKSFNDTYGHRCGDEVLCLLSHVMRDCVRNVDIVSRYGGEEFAILCPQQSLDEARMPAERIRRTVEQSVLELSGHEVRCTVSIGLATFPTDGRTPEELMENADRALYHAKHNGRNRICVFRELTPHEREAALAVSPPEGMA